MSEAFFDHLGRFVEEKAFPFEEEHFAKRCDTAHTDAVKGTFVQPRDLRLVFVLLVRVIAAHPLMSALTPRLRAPLIPHAAVQKQLQNHISTPWWPLNIQTFHHPSPFNLPTQVHQGSEQIIRAIEALQVIPTRLSRLFVQSMCLCALATPLLF